jgi:hypothetical protein
MSFVKFISRICVLYVYLILVCVCVHVCVYHTVVLLGVPCDICKILTIYHN